jgi:hypothetical protein
MLEKRIKAKRMESISDPLCFYLFSWHSECTLQSKELSDNN